MAVSKHWCQDCQKHFKSEPEVHADTYHDGSYFRGIVDGDWRHFEEDELINGE